MLWETYDIITVEVFFPDDILKKSLIEHLYTEGFPFFPSSLMYSILEQYCNCYFPSRDFLCFFNNWTSWKVSCSNRITRLRTTSNAKVHGWISAINDAALNPPEGWCHPHRYGSFAPPRGLIEDGSQAQWFVDGQAAFEAIASSIETAKSEVQPSHRKAPLSIQISRLFYHQIL